MLRIYFLSKLLFPLIKGSTSPQLKTIFGKLNFWQNIDRRWPNKNVENLNYLKLWQENIFVKIICSTHQMKCFWTIVGNFWKIEFLTKYRQVQKWWKFCIISKCAKKIFLSKLFVPLIKGSVSPQFYAIIDIKSTGPDLTKTVLNCDKKTFFVKIIISTHQIKFFWTIVGNFWKIEFLTEYRQARTLQKWRKFCIISKCATKIFFVKLLFPLIKGSVSPKF